MMTLEDMKRVLVGSDPRTLLVLFGVTTESLPIQDCVGVQITCENRQLTIDAIYKGGFKRITWNGESWE